MAYLVDDSGNHLVDQSGNWLTTDVSAFDPTTLTALSASPSSPVTPGTTVILTATVTSSGSAATGTVNFLDGATVIGTGTLSGTTATFSTSALSVGTHSLTAAYLGDGTYTASTSSAISYTVSTAATTIALVGSPSPGSFVYPTSITFTATVTPSTATGIVNIYDGVGAILGGTISGGTITLTAPSLSVGNHPISAQYMGDGTHNPSTSATLTYTFTTATSITTTTVLTGVPASPVYYGTPITFTATVTPSAATGIVNIYDGAGAILGGTISGGIGVFVAPSLSVGPHSITAQYTGDSSYNPSASSALSYTIFAVAPPPDLAVAQGGSGKGKSGKGRSKGKHRPPIRPPFEYNRPILSEYAAQLRRAVQRNAPARAEEIAGQIVKVAEPLAALPQAQGVVDIAQRLTQLQKLDIAARHQAAQTLALRAKMLEHALDDSDAEMLLLS